MASIYRLLFINLLTFYFDRFFLTQPRDEVLDMDGQIEGQIEGQRQREREREEREREIGNNK